MNHPPEITCTPAQRLFEDQILAAPLPSVHPSFVHQLAGVVVGRLGYRRPAALMATRSDVPMRAVSVADLAKLPLGTILRATSGFAVRVMEKRSLLGRPVWASAGDNGNISEKHLAEFFLTDWTLTPVFIPTPTPKDQEHRP